MKTRISHFMFISLVINVIYAKAIGVSQGMISRSIGHDMWISTLIGFAQGAAVMALTYYVLRKAPGSDVFQFTEKLIGKWGAKGIGLILFGFFLAAFGPVMITFVYHLRDYFLPEAPVWIFIFAAILIACLGCFYGIEVIARMATIGVIFAILLNLLIIIGSFEEFDLRNLLPVLEPGLPKVIMASRHIDADWSIATVMAAMILPVVQEKKKNGMSGVAGIWLAGLFVILWPILETAVLSSEVTSAYIVSCMKLARNAHIGNFLQRYEIIMIALFSISALIQVMMCVYCASLAASRVFGLNSHRPAVIPAGLLMGVLGYFVVRNHFDAMNLLHHYWPWIALPVSFGIPVLLLGLGKVFGRKLKNNNTKKAA